MVKWADSFCYLNLLQIASNLLKHLSNPIYMVRQAVDNDAVVQPSLLMLRQAYDQSNDRKCHHAASGKLQVQHVFY